MASLQTPERAALTLAALLVAALAWVDLASWQDEQRRLTELWQASGLAGRYPAVAGEVSRDPDRELARLRVARALFAAELDPARFEAMSTDALRADAERGLVRLAQARELAAETLASRAASWRAATILGGATFVEMSRRRDPRAGARPEIWEEPLRAAHRLAPGHPEPPRLLAGAYLGNWSRLPQAARERALETIETALRDLTTFDLLVETWLRVAPSLDAALEVIPSSPTAWAKLKQILLRRGDLERYRDIHERWFASLRPHMEEVLADADRHLRAGDTAAAAERYARIARLPPDRRFQDLLQVALERSPPSERRAGGSELFDPWLEWALDLCLVEHCPLPPALFGRLTELSSELDPAERAFAALASGTESLAELYERKAPTLASEEWRPYLIYKARRLAGLLRATEATETLAELGVEGRSTPLYWQARLEVARQQGDDEAVREASAALHALAPTELSGARWRPWRDSWRLDLFAPHEAARLVVDVPGLVERGIVVEARLDGASAGFFHLTPGDRLRIETTVTPGVHRLEVTPLRGRVAQPGPVSLGVADAG